MKRSLPLDASFSSKTVRSLLSLLAVFLLVAVASAENTKNFHYTVGDGAQVSIYNLNGKVSVHPSKARVVNVTARITSDKVEIDSQQNGNRIEVRTHMLQKVSPQDAAVDYEIQVPADASLNIESAMGPIQVENLSGDVVLSGESAEVLARGINSGSLQIETVSGPVTLQDISKCRVQVTSTTGAVDLKAVTGPNVVIKTASGDIHYTGDFAGGGTYALFNNSGEIVVSLPASASVDVKARSMKGSVESNFPFRKNEHPGFAFVEGRTLAGTANSGASSVELHSLNGKIRINKQ
jgi:DUF4097 and DUF4098 domain-containing protein YvlB